VKPIPALVLFLAGLLTGTALTWMAVRPETAPRATRAPRGAPAGAPGAATGAAPVAGPGAPVAAPVAAPSTPGELATLGEADDEADVEPADTANGSSDDGAGAIESAGIIEVARAEIIDHGSWAKQGFVEMVPPVRLPSDGTARDEIEVWLRVPEGARIRGKKLPDGRATIEFPPGTIADRVESWGYARSDDGAGWKYSVTDVRGTRIDAKTGQEMFHVFVPTGPEPLARLVGWEWPRGDRLQERAATSFLISHLETLRTIQDRGLPQSADERRALIENYRRNNNCAKCHAHDKPAQVNRPRGIHRATDASGFYVPLSVLMDTVPLEKHRARDMNVGDPFMTFACPNGDGPVLAEGAGGARDFRCLEGGAPAGTLDVRKALAANDARTVAMCKSRAYLHARMDDAGRALFADAFSACGL
jgi:hypothetical protein